MNNGRDCEHGHHVGHCCHCDLADAEKEIYRLRGAMDRIYKILLSEPDTKGALFKAENIMRETLSDVGA